MHDHFNDPKNVDDLDTNDSRVTVGLSGNSTGDVIRIYLLTNLDGVVEAARFKCFGSAPIVAAGSFVTESVQGHHLDRATLISAAEIVSALGLSSDHEAHIQCVTDALRLAVDAARGNGGGNSRGGRAGGILTDFFVCRSEAIQALSARAVRPLLYPHLQSKGVDIEALDRLSDALRTLRIGQLPVDLELSSFFTPQEDDELWIFQFPSALLSAIAEMDEAQIPKVAKAWGGLRASSAVRQEELAELLIQLRTLARLARKRKESLFLWMSL